MKTPKTPKTPETNSRGVPVADMLAIVASVSNALAQVMTEEGNDSIPTWPSVKGPVKPDIHLKARLADQLLRGNGGTRLQYVIKNATPPEKSEWFRSVWMLHNWVAFKKGGEPAEDAGMNLDFDDLGLCYLTDETAAGRVEAEFDMGEFTTKQFRDFRRKYKLLQVPKAHRMSGIFLNGGLKIIRKGRKRVSGR
ncbi:MAG: hypothetical protein NTW21_37605 [Verrucomicrobia bacterium]|nr:hypothetical protein [Verrucomicrobiota bacterium]